MQDFSGSSQDALLRPSSPPWSDKRKKSAERFRPAPKVCNAHIASEGLPSTVSPDRLTGGQRRDLMEIVEDRHGRSSTLIASQLPVKAWHDLIGEPTFADAILDRLVHNAYRLELEGPRSMRDGADGQAQAESTATPVVANGKSAKGARK